MRNCAAAVVQMRATPDGEQSVATARTLAEQAAKAGASLVVLPENFAGMGPLADRGSRAFDPRDPGKHPGLAPFLRLSAETPAVLVLGGIPEQRPPGSGPPFNTLLVLQGGRVRARYRKIHLFDTHITAPPLEESRYTSPGTRPVVVDTPVGRIGLSICYDLRFPLLYRALVAAGAEILVVPSAFTVPTGRAHWEPLLRARAIETQSYVLAPAQHGHHGHGRESYGHSMIVDPWGVIAAEVPTGDGVITAELSADVLEDVRNRMPVAHHRRLNPETSAQVISLHESDPWS